jgi:hypothetical protein
VHRIRHNRFAHFLTALVLGIVVSGVVVELGQWMYGWTVAGRGKAKEPEAIALSDDHPAWRYVHALEQGKWEAAVAMTGWMAERLERVRAQGGNEEAVAAARGELIQRLSARVGEDNRLGPEGIEDQYVFAPGTKVTAVGKDAGHAGLEPLPVERVWMRVVFTSKVEAPVDKQGRPVCAMTVGINLDSTGRVIKAGIIGNLDISQTSIVCD